jgi:acetyl-CoA synthetase
VTTARPGYHAVYPGFDAASLADELEGDLTAGLNACVECCDRHTGDNRVALTWVGASGDRKTSTFEDLTLESARVANLLVSHGVEPGDRVAGLLPRVPELVALILGCLRAGAVYQPLFTAFGPGAIGHRLSTSKAKVVVTDAANRAKLDGLVDSTVTMSIGGTGGEIDYAASLASQASTFEPIMRTGADALFLMSTSGTTGPPKGVAVPLRALPAFIAYMRFGLDLLPDDVFWNMADPGWAYGLYYAVIGPLLVGHQTTLFDGPFSVDGVGAVIDELGITNFASAPTAYRAMMTAGPETERILASNLRVASSAGEPLSPEVMRWFHDHAGCDLFDQYGQTEIGMALANHHGLAHEVTPGSAGLAMPGFMLDVVDEQGTPLPPDTPGILAVHRPGSSLFFFDGYLGREGQDWIGDYYLTGDSVERNEDGVFSFIGRSDDVISSSGYRIGPFEVESSLLEHEAVAESAVIGKPDPKRGEIVKAFVVLHPRREGDDALAAELQEHVRTRLSKHAFPREIEFVESLPKTPSGKIQRFLLRAHPVNDRSDT